MGENRVIAPYATGLATMVDPAAAAANFKRLATLGASGRYGFYEAVDFTATRVPEGDRFAIVRAFMAHHQGMTIVGIANAVFDGAMRERFHAEPIVQATELLLQERVPREVASTRPWAAEVKSGARASDVDPSGGRRIVSVHQSTPATQLLSNGSYAVMMTAAGSGYSRWGDVAVTRWREDATRDDNGSYIFLRDTRSGAVWSAGFQPTGVEPDEYAVDFNEDRVEIARRDGTLTTTLEVLVSAEDDAEVRRVSISNAGGRARDIEITSYSELALGPQGADVAHPAFAKLFVETEYLEDFGAIVATRRKRTPSEPELWAAHLSVADGEAVGKPEFETDRARFLGRGQGVRTPIAIMDVRPLTNSVGAVLDPIFALRRRVRVAAGATVRVAFWTMAAGTREALLDCVDKHRDASAYERATTLAWTQAQVQLHHLGVNPGEAGLFQRLASHVIFAGPDLRPSSDVIRQGSGPQSGLWSQGVSGDLPIVLLRIAEIETLHVARQVLQAHEYWRMKQLAVDLVILNERRSSYVQDLQAAIETLVRASQSRPAPGLDHRLGRVFVLRADLIDPDMRALLISTARIVLVAQHGSLSDQLNRIAESIDPMRSIKETPVPSPERPATLRGVGARILQWPGRICCRRQGICDDPGARPIDSSALGQRHRQSDVRLPDRDRRQRLHLVRQQPREPAHPLVERSDQRPARRGLLCARRQDRRRLESDSGPYPRPRGSLCRPSWPRLQPVRAQRAWRRRQSSSVCADRRIDKDIAAPLDEHIEHHPPSQRDRLCRVGARRIEICDARVCRNRDRRRRPARFSHAIPRISCLVRVSLLPTCEASKPTGPATAASSLGATARSPIRPRSRPRGRCQTRSGAALDPCAAMRAKVALQPGGVVEVVFFLGEAATREDARAAILFFRAADLDALEADIARSWDETLSVIEVKTPDRAMDLMLNGWLLYQTLACRIWARSAFYQASGAYGFRDQLQDGMALTAVRPDLTRQHLLRAAARQFAEGDVQHWWLPHSGQGVRTRISDDRPWLAYTVAQYVETTQDTLVLDELLPFLEGAQLEAGETDRFFQPTVSETRVTLFEHCALALDASLATGRHGLPLIGTGDWNDGMNRVGEKGEGESVWLGWFLHAALTAFAPLALARNETMRAEKWTAHAAALKAAIEREAWDGEWYRRGYFDDGAPLGSAESDECRIDSIAQSWAVLSGAATPERAALAMAALDRQLIRRSDGLALLFTPPFDRTTHDPGYIKAYPPGVRENGGQYTHAATWSVMAFAALGEGDKAAGLFSLLNPINHSRTPADAYRYKVEPYIVCADLYSTAPHVGRGGWTWYTGSAGWLQRAGVESLLGLRFRGAFLSVDPCIPKAWGQYEATVKYRTARYSICVENPGGVSRGVVFAEIDGHEISARPLVVALLDDGGRHRVNVRLG